MKKIKVISVLITLFFLSCLQMGAKGKEVYVVEIKTNFGEIVLKLSNLTPIHRDNFVKLCQTGHYNDLLFHRVIKDFVIQAGDPESRNHEVGKLYGDGDLGYSPAAEIRKELFHKKGVLAAAREGDSVNPERKSSASQFYIVVGRVQSDEDIKKSRDRINKSNKTSDFQFSTEAVGIYKTVGGVPHLDTQYTIFGEVLTGMDVVESISLVATDKNDRPMSDIVIVSTKVLKLKDRAIYKKYKQF